MHASSWTRREILKSLSAVGLSVPWVIPSSALGDEQKAPASERVTVGHIGVGNRGRSLVREFASSKLTQSVAAADCYKDRREAVAAMIHGKAYADFRELLARPDIDAVVVATPDHWHVPIAIAAARAKKDAYVEKPLGLTIEQDIACRKVFDEHHRVFQYGTQQRSSSHCRFGCELVRNGRIGKVEALEVIAPNGGRGGSTKEVPVPAGFDFDMWCGPSPKTPYTADRCKPPATYWVNDYSIGYLAGWGAHPLDIMVWGSEADLAGPMSVSGTGEIPKEGLYDTVFNWDVQIEMAQGVKMSFKPGGDSTKFIGPKGWVRIWRGGIDAEPKSLLKSVIEPGETHLIQSNHHAENFLKAVKSRGPTVSNLADAVRSDILSHLANIAIRTQRKITWDPKKEELVGDPEAAKMLSRPTRQPWTL